jgi:ABC-type antimicrobial peptide transport system permease subunit
VVYRARILAALVDNPLSAAPQQAVLAIALAAALLAALGFSVSVAASVRERRTQSAVLSALGVSRTAQARQLCLEELLLSGPAAVAGLLLGAGIAHLLVPAVTLTASAATPVPVPLIELPLGWAAGLAALITAIPVLVAAATIARRSDPAARLRAAEAV